MAAETIEIQVNCTGCGGTGLQLTIPGLDSMPGVAVICGTCHGHGAEKMTITPYNGRVPIEGIEQVFYDAGASFGFIGPCTSYGEFIELVPASVVQLPVQLTV